MMYHVHHYCFIHHHRHHQDSSSSSKVIIIIIINIIIINYNHIYCVIPYLYIQRLAPPLRVNIDASQIT